MDKVWAVFKREYLERVRLKSFLIATIFGPLLMAVLLILPAWLATKTRISSDAGNVLVIDASGTDLGDRVARQLARNGGSPEVRAVAPGDVAAAESLATADVVAKRREGYLVIGQETVSGERARYAGRNASTLPDMRFVEDAVEQSVRNSRFEAAGLDGPRVQAMSDVRLQLATERLSERGRGSAGRENVALAYVIAMLLYMSILLYGQSIMMSVIEEKTQRVAEVVVSAIRPNQLLAGKVLGVGAVGLTQQVIWVASGVLLLRFQQPIMKAMGLAGAPITMPGVSLGTLLVFLLFFVLGFTFFTAMFAAGGSMVSSTQDAQQVATPLTMLVIPSLLLLSPVMLEPNGTLSRVVTMVPFTSPILMPVRISLTSVPWFEVLGSLVLLALTCLGAIWLAARIYRVGVLMYGKKPTMRELARWVRAR
jgi:ABC-2 type transport system permease protein